MNEPTNNEELTGIEDKEVSALFTDLSDTLSGGIESLANSPSQQKEDIEAAYKELHEMKMKLLQDYEQVIESMRTAANKDVEAIQVKIDAKEDLTVGDLDRVNKAKLVLANIKELEENNNILDWVDSVSTEEIINPFKAKYLETKFIHKLRTHRIKRSNIEGTYDLINKIKIVELREKCLYFYNCLLNTYIDKDLSAYKFYIVFIMGILRLSIKTTCSFNTMEIIYSAVKNIPLKEDTL